MIIFRINEQLFIHDKSPGATFTFMYQNVSLYSSICITYREISSTCVCIDVVRQEQMFATKLCIA